MATTGTLGTGLAPGDTGRAAPLRSVDWRFLLPVAPDTRFPDLAVLGGPRGVLLRAQLTGLSHDVTDALPAPGRAHAVAAYHDAPYDIADIAASIAEGGILYLEVDRTRRGIRETSPARVEAEIQAAGLSVLSMYAAEPTLRDARAFVSLDVPRGMDWHRAATFGPTPTIRLGSIVRRATTRVAGRTGAVLRGSYSVVAVRGKSGPSMPWILAKSKFATFGNWTEPPVGVVMLTYGGDRVVFFPFDRDSREPMAVIKVPKLESFIGRTENEHALTSALRSSLDPGLASGIPEPLGIRRVGSTVLAIERFVRGTTLAALARDPQRSVDAKLQDLSLAMSWLTRFHRATEVRRAPWRDGRAAALDDPIRAYSATCSSSEEETSLFRHALTAADALGAAETVLPIVCQHRDYAAWNVLRDGEVIGVVDWEGAREGPAVHDALHLITTWLYAVHLGEGIDDEARCVRELFLEGDRRSTAAQGAVRVASRYLRELAIDPRLVPFLLLSHRVELAARRREQRRLQMGDAPGEAETLSETRILGMLGREATRLFEPGRGGW